MKENQNTLDYNIWSGTEYKNNLEDIYYIPNTVKANPSTVWSSIGEQSLHLTTTTDGYQAVTIKQLTSTINKTMTIECDILHQKGGTCQLRIRQSDDTLTDVNIPVNTDTQHISLSKQITADGTVQVILILRNSTDEVYTDNICLTTS